jgi:transposase
MSLQPQDWSSIPIETVRVARAIFPDGSPAMQIRDEVGVLFEDQALAALFPSRGQPAFSPSRLLLVTILQFMEGLTDRQAADAVRRCIDWKYALALDLTDVGFDFSVLSEFRARLVAADHGPVLLDHLLTICRKRGWVRARAQQRTDATHVLAAIRLLNRLECVGETLYHALHSLLVVDPTWIQAQVPLDWWDRYARRFEDFRLPQEASKRQVLATTIGSDGVQLLKWVDAAATSEVLGQLPAIQTLRQVWSQQYLVSDDAVSWRREEELPPSAERIVSPYDVEARRGKKRDTVWTGYKVHLTETCDDAGPHLITDVQTTPATTVDGACTTRIHTALAQRELLPAEHYVDSGYVDADALVDSRDDYQIELLGPVPPDTSWQARTPGAYPLACFQVDWEAQRVTCPEGNISRKWNPGQDEHGHSIITIWFDESRCTPCPVRSRCTVATTRPRTMQLRAQAQFEALQGRRREQTTERFKRRYARRAGIEGTLAQGVGAFEMRWARYRGLAKTALQHIFIALALNLWRLVAWWEERPRAQTRRSRFAAHLPAMSPAISTTA